LRVFQKGLFTWRRISSLKPFTW